MRWLCIVAFATAAAAQDPAGSITGVVRDSISQLPVKKATVTIHQQRGNFERPPQWRSIVTDATGSFAADNLPPGTYMLQAQGDTYPVGPAGIAHKNIEVKSGQTGDRVALELVPGAAVSGRVLDEDGDPLSGCSVELMSAKNRNQGVSLRGGGITNDDGEYRHYAIPAGKYRLIARCNAAVFQARPFSAGPDPPPSQAYPPQYYPLASDIKSAQIIELAPGSEKSRLDFRMKPAAVTQVRASFSPSGADWHGHDDLQPDLFPADPSATRQFDMGGNFDSTKGTVEFQKVFPGSYVLVIASRGQNGNPIGAMQRIEVKDKPLGTTIELRPAADLNGSIQLEDTGSNKIPLNQVLVWLNPAQPGAINAVNTHAQEDGKFVLNGVLPGLWRLQVEAGNAFVKSVRLGNDDVTGRPLDLSSGAPGQLTVTMSNKTAAIRGSAPVGSVVYIENITGDSSNFRRALVGRSGEYVIEGLAPGKYRIASAEAGDQMPEEGGQEITLHEGETLNFDLKEG